jgi:ABC-type transport system involved in multi-copper enzyme maturation permease subunit
MLGGRRYWIVPLLPLIWPALQALFLVLGWRETSIGPVQIQNVLIGVPLAALSSFLGLRIIAGEIDRRTLEIVYTVPGGAWRVWTAKLIGAAAMIVTSEILLAGVAWALFSSFPPEALVGALQSSLFCLVLSMTMAAWTRSEATGGMLVAGVLVVVGFATGWGANPLRISPFWNVAEALEQHDTADVIAWTIQNRIGFVLAIAALIALGYVRAESREKLLAG